jgi:nifR3 family TIM-barrel protein
MSIWQKLKTQSPILAMAPMEGFTDSAMRQVVKTLVPEVLCYTEFTSADAIKYQSEKSKNKLYFVEAERPIIVQLFGKNIENFIEAAKWVESQGADGLDINMGCPAKNVIASEHGAAMIKNPDHAAELISTLSKHTKLPLSVKTRIGFDKKDLDHFLNFTDKLIQSGAQAIAVHGRTAKQGYTGEADWSFAYELKKRHPEILILGNGDIKTGSQALEKIGNLNGVMVGRATIGNPWIMREIKLSLQGKATPNAEINFIEKLPIINKHCELLVEIKGEKLAMLEIRKHLSAYIKGFDQAAHYRSELVRVESLKQVQAILTEIENQFTQIQI